VRVPAWISEQQNKPLAVVFAPGAEADLGRVFADAEAGGAGAPRFGFLKSAAQARQAIAEVVGGEPRSHYRREFCADDLYVFPIDGVDVECQFRGEEARVLAVRPKKY
jgi:hypothetical protein